MSSQQNEDETKEKKYPHTLEFSLVLVMLGVLTLLLVIMVVFPLLMVGKVDGPECNQEIIDYSKWVVTALLAAFGAWIGAGAAYFFGKANLRESSRSTEAALKIVRGTHGLKYIKDINLTAMNTNFLFDLDKTYNDVNEKLKDNVGYWFVPVIDKENGVLRDVIHSQIFWKQEFNDIDTLKAIIENIDTKENGKDLHGEKFYVKINLNDSIEDVYKTMKAKSIPVAIVVDEKGRPTHCLTRTDLATLLQMKEND